MKLGMRKMQTVNRYKLIQSDTIHLLPGGLVKGKNLFKNRKLTAAATERTVAIKITARWV